VARRIAILELQRLTDRDQFLDAVRRVAAKDREGFAERDEVAVELGIGLRQVTELVRRYEDDFEWNSIPGTKDEQRPSWNFSRCHWSD
jgi:hypothetical protein